LAALLSVDAEFLKVNVLLRRFQEEIVDVLHEEDKHEEGGVVQFGEDAGLVFALVEAHLLQFLFCYKFAVVEDIHGCDESVPQVELPVKQVRADFARLLWQVALGECGPVL
jgi:hypothetical protein